MPRTRAPLRAPNRISPVRLSARAAFGVGLALVVFPLLCAADDLPLRLVRHVSLPQFSLARADAPPATHALRVDLALITGSRRAPQEVLDATLAAAGILAQCGIRAQAVDLHEFDGPLRYRMLDTPVSREFARRARLGRPAVFFVADTSHRPAFDAEAIGRANSRERPEMADTVWITDAARDLTVVIAHELAHVLADSGAHSDEPDNLMREDTAPGNTRLNRAQCGALVATAAANGLLQVLQ